MERLFSPRDVDALLPKIEAIFKHIDMCRARTHELAATRPAAADHPTVAEIADAARIRAQMEFLLTAIQEDIGLISQAGGAVKDVDLGLVDFLGHVEGEDVYLCWKRGEKKIEFWHPIYAGYSERQTLKRASNRAAPTH